MVIDIIYDKHFTAHCFANGYNRLKLLFLARVFMRMALFLFGLLFIGLKMFCFSKKRKTVDYLIVVDMKDSLDLSAISPGLSESPSSKTFLYK